MKIFMLIKGLIEAFFSFIICISMTMIATFIYLLTFLSTRHVNSIRDAWEIPPEVLIDPDYGRHRFITVNGVQLHYVENGHPSMPLMLFVHGFPEFWYSWRFQIREFSRYYRTVAIDLRGYGDSDKPNGLHNYNLSVLVKDLKELIQRLNGNRKCILVCHDWGALIGWEFLIDNMDMVSSYIMMGAPSAYVWKKSLYTHVDQFRKSLYVFFFQTLWFPEIFLHRLGIEFLFNFDTYHRTFFPEDLNAYNFIFSCPESYKRPLDYYRENLKFFEEPNNAYNLPHYAPGLYILGEYDSYISKKTGPMLQQMYQNLEFFIIHDSHHLVHQDNWLVTNKLMKKFLRIRR